MMKFKLGEKKPVVPKRVPFVALIVLCCNSLPNSVGNTKKKAAHAMKITHIIPLIVDDTKRGIFLR